MILGISIATGLVLYALRQNIDLFYTPSEVVEGKDGNPDQKPEVGQRIRVGGMVVEGSVSRDPKSLKVRFDVNDIGPSITVEYEGILPDLFREGQGIVAQGVLKEPTLLEATEVLAKHDEMQKMHKPMGAELKGESEADRRYKETQQKSQEGR